MTDKTPNTINYVELPAPNVAALAQSKRFFSEAFGWTWKEWGDEYADTHSSGVNSGLNGTNEHRPSHPLVVLYVSNLEEARARVIAAGGAITDDIFNFP